MRTNRLIRNATVAAVLGLIAPAVAWGHADIDQQVAAVTEAIAADPDNPDLFHKRADLHSAHREYALALADYDRALALDPDRVGSLVGRSAALLKSDRPADALAAADRAIGLAPDAPAPHLARARALAALGKATGSDNAYTRSTALQKRATPELFIEHATALQQADPPNRRRAIEVLQHGIETIGPVVTLAVPLFELHLATGDPAAALKLCETLPPALTKTPNWLLRRSDALAALGRLDEAAAALDRARAAITALPARRRNTAAMQQILADIEDARASLADK